MNITDIIHVFAPKRKKGAADGPWRAKIGKAEGTGPDRDSALLALSIRIKGVFNSHYTVYTLGSRGSVGIVWLTLDGWAYKMAMPEEEEEGRVHWGAILIGGTQKEAIRALRFQMAQNLWNGEEETSPVILNDVPYSLLDTHNQESFSRWARWQKRYKEIKASSSGLSDTAIRAQLRGEGY